MNTELERTALSPVIRQKNCIDANFSCSRLAAIQSGIKMYFITKLLACVSFQENKKFYNKLLEQGEAKVLKFLFYYDT